MGDLPLSLLAFAGSVVADRVDREEKAVQPVRFLSPGTPRHASRSARRQRGSCAAAPDDDVVSCCSSGSSGAAGSSDGCFLGFTEKVPQHFVLGERHSSKRSTVTLLFFLLNPNFVVVFGQIRIFLQVPRLDFTQCPKCRNEQALHYENNPFSKIPLKFCREVERIAFAARPTSASRFGLGTGACGARLFLNRFFLAAA